jgi:tetratricopeptide (TPR) repeat protein
MKCIFQKSYREAIKDFNSAQKQNGNSYVMDHSYVFYKGLCYLQLNKFDSAEYFIGNEINKELKERNSVHYLHWFYLGIIQFEKEDYTKALESFDNCLSEYSQLPDAMYYKSLCLFRQKQYKKALELALVAKENMKIGYAINEDNAIYEVYPYQLNKNMLNAFIEGLNQIKQ